MAEVTNVNAVTRELLEVERHPHQRARHLAQRAVGPDARACVGRVDDLDAEVVGEADTLGAAGEHRLRADVDGRSARSRC